jgi:hypothetical protein
MRFSNSLLLFVLSLMAVSLSASVSPLSARTPVAKPGRSLIQKEWIGYGKTAKEAEKDALRQGCDWLAVEGGLEWSPDADYLLNHNLVRFSEPEVKEFDDDIFEGPDIQKQARHQRMKERQKHSLLGLLGMMGLLGVVGGYLRLEEATKGYYTRLLRIAALSVLAVIVAGLCVAG